MKEQLPKRLAELKAELASAQKMSAELESRQASMRETLLRMSGEIQVLEEELAKEEQEDARRTDSAGHV